MVEYSPEIGSALGALQAVPGLGAIASVASLAYSLLGDAPEPRLKMPAPFAPASILWGVRRRREGPFAEISFEATYSMRRAPAPVKGRDRVGTERIGELNRLATGERQRVKLPGDYSPHGGLRVARPPTTQTIPYYLSKSVSPKDRRPMGPGDLLWAEALRRGTPGALAGQLLYARASGGPSLGGEQVYAYAIEVHEVHVGGGWWDSWIDEDGAIVSKELKRELLAAPARRAAEGAPEFDEFDLRGWEGRHIDTWMASAAERGEQGTGSLADWRAGKSAAAAAARSAIEAEQLEERAAHAGRVKLWEGWRFALGAELERRKLYEQAEAAWEAQYYQGISSGLTPAEAAAQVELLETYAPEDVATDADPSAAPASGAPSSDTLVAAVGLGALAAALALL